MAKVNGVEMPESPYTLRTPVEFEGETINELAYDFDSLSGMDIILAERQMGVVNTGDVKPVVAMSLEFQAIVFAKAAGKPVELMQKLKAPDFIEVCARAGLFLTMQA